jgi:uncharacterized protein (DUF2336 family)
MQSQNFFGLDGLTDLSRRSGIDMRPTLLRVLTDLYVHRLSHSADEERHYTELALRMLEAVDVATRVAVAKRFAHYQRPPLRVLQRLARDLPVVAAELRSHPLLQAAGSTTTGGGAAAAPAPIDPADDESIVRKPANTIDAETAVELNELFFTADTTERRLILLNMHVADPNPPLQRRVIAPASIGDELEGALLTGKRELFAARLAQALRISHEQARRIANDELGEPVLVAGKTLTLRRDVLYRILMFVNPAVGHSVQRVHTLAALYDTLHIGAAEAMLAIWQALPAAERARFGQRAPLQEENRPRTRGAALTQRTTVAPQAKDLRNVS